MNKRNRDVDFYSGFVLLKIQPQCAWSNSRNACTCNSEPLVAAVHLPSTAIPECSPCNR